MGVKILIKNIIYIGYERNTIHIKYSATAFYASHLVSKLSKIRLSESLEGGGRHHEEISVGYIMELKQIFPEKAIQNHSHAVGYLYTSHE